MLAQCNWLQKTVFDCVYLVVDWEPVQVVIEINWIDDCSVFHVSLNSLQI